MLQASRAWTATILTALACRRHARPIWRRASRRPAVRGSISGPDRDRQAVRVAAGRGRMRQRRAGADATRDGEERERIEEVVRRRAAWRLARDERGRQPSLAQDAPAFAHAVGIRA